MLEQRVLDSTSGDALNKALRGERLDFKDGVSLFQEEDLHLVAYVADKVRQRVVGENISFVVGYNMNYSNVCVASCQICAFYRKKDDNDAYTYSKNEVLQQVAEGVGWGATEVHIVGGLNQYLSLEYYEEIFAAIKEKFPRVIIKALTMAEVFFIAKITKNTIQEVLSRLKTSGLGALPGGGAEIFHSDIRPFVARGKLTAEEWLRTAEEAHRMGIRSNSTMLYDHIEDDTHRVDHIIRLRDLQDKTGGFISFIPLKFSPPNTELLASGSLHRVTSPLIDIRVTAVSRLLLADSINNIVVYWVPLGKDVAQSCLLAGGNDLMGTSFREKIYKEAGKDEIATKADLAKLVTEIGRAPVERDTFYNIIQRI
ncbi:MAG: radical SAM protein [Nitrososphaerales archaeon]